MTSLASGLYVPQIYKNLQSIVAVRKILRDTMSHLLELPFLFSPACLQESEVLQLGDEEHASSDQIPSHKHILQKIQKIIKN